MYIVTNKHNTVVYVGVTNNVFRRTLEHREGVGSLFTSMYRCKKLVYFEVFDYVYDAIRREKEIKKWRREKKERLINSVNPGWRDLFNELVE